jgi:hypothetical protein
MTHVNGRLAAFLLLKRAVDRVHRAVLHAIDENAEPALVPRAEQL